MIINNPELNSRPETVQDKTFLERLYRSTREDLLLLGQGTLIDNLIQMQFMVQQTSYHQQFPNANFAIIEKNAKSIGYLVANHTNETIRLVYLAFLPDERNQGHGRCVIQALQTEAVNQNKSLALSVSAQNEPAKHLYLSLGFQTSVDDGINLEMIYARSQALETMKVF